jgi:hypothetical protein
MQPHITREYVRVEALRDRPNRCECVSFNGRSYAISQACIVFVSQYFKVNGAPSSEIPHSSPSTYSTDVVELFLKPFQGKVVTITLSHALELQHLCFELDVEMFDDDIVRVVNEASMDDFGRVARTALDFGHSTIDFEHQFSQ